ncbi:hypothetical protein BJ944DRAFT_239862 [Cunninghamella echinulata]|nr:hypothetical protein BJ944DRAFT_239862 [Cunninghamella echinulata]
MGKRSKWHEWYNEICTVVNHYKEVNRKLAYENEQLATRNRQLHELLRKALMGKLEINYFGQEKSEQDIVTTSSSTIINSLEISTSSNNNNNNSNNSNLPLHHSKDIPLHKKSTTAFKNFKGKNISILNTVFENEDPTLMLPSSSSSSSLQNDHQKQHPSSPTDYLEKQNKETIHGNIDESSLINSYQPSQVPMKIKNSFYKGNNVFQKDSFFNDNDEGSDNDDDRRYIDLPMPESPSSPNHFISSSNSSSVIRSFRHSFSQSPSESPMNSLLEINRQNDSNLQDENRTRLRRRKTTINYKLPSLNSKLRKGDRNSFTF